MSTAARTRVLALGAAALALAVTGCAPGGAATTTGSGASAVPAGIPPAGTPPASAAPWRTSAGSPASSVTSSATPTPTPSSSTPDPAVSSPRPRVAGVLRAAGVRQWIHCAGQGEITVVVVPGLGSPARDWAGVRPGLQRLSRTCVYDRPGLGRSPARADGRSVIDAGRYARELAALLAAAGEPGPYLVVGHSFGGLVARAFVRRNLDETAAVLLAESVTPYDPTLGSYWSEAGLAVDLAASSRATGGGPALGARPLLVMTASRADADHLTGPGYAQSAAVTAEWLAGQRRNLALSSDAMQVVARSGHVLQQDAPRAVLEGVRELLVASGTGRPLRCTAVWRSLDAICRTAGRTD